MKEREKWRERPICNRMKQLLMNRVMKKCKLYPSILWEEEEAEENMTTQKTSYTICDIAEEWMNCILWCSLWAQSNTINMTGGKATITFLLLVLAMKMISLLSKESQLRFGHRTPQPCVQLAFDGTQDISRYWCGAINRCYWNWHHSDNNIMYHKHTCGQQLCLRSSVPSTSSWCAIIMFDPSSIRHRLHLLPLHHWTNSG